MLFSFVYLSIGPGTLAPVGDRNPIEGKFGQAKTAYGLNRIKARLSNTSLSWIATIMMVLNLVKLTGQVLYYLTCKIINEVRLIKQPAYPILYVAVA